mgnify:CR=1 FL=1
MIVKENLNDDDESVAKLTIEKSTYIMIIAMQWFDGKFSMTVQMCDKNSNVWKRIDLIMMFSVFSEWIEWINEWKAKQCCCFSPFNF